MVQKAARNSKSIGRQTFCLDLLQKRALTSLPSRRVEANNAEEKKGKSTLLSKLSSLGKIVKEEVCEARQGTGGVSSQETAGTLSSTDNLPGPQYTCVICSERFFTKEDWQEHEQQELAVFDDLSDPHSTPADQEPLASSTSHESPPPTSIREVLEAQREAIAKALKETHSFQATNHVRRTTSAPKRKAGTAIFGQCADKRKATTKSAPNRTNSGAFKGGLQQQVFEKKGEFKEGAQVQRKAGNSLFHWADFRAQEAQPEPLYEELSTDEEEEECCILDTCSFCNKKVNPRVHDCKVDCPSCHKKIRSSLLGEHTTKCIETSHLAIPPPPTPDPRPVPDASFVCYELFVSLR